MSKTERPIPEIIYRQEDRYMFSNTLKAFVNGVRVGYLEYSRNFNEGGWNIENVIVNEEARGKGIGKALISSLVDRVGPDQKVHAAIIHKSTYETLIARYGTNLEPGITVEVPTEDMPNLALARGLRSCGIEVTKVMVDINLPETEDVMSNVEFEGITLSRGANNAS